MECECGNWAKYYFGIYYTEIILCLQLPIFYCRFDKEAPEEESIPDGYNSMDVFRKLLMVRAWCPDRTLAQSL